MRARIKVFAVLPAIVLALAGCGGDDENDQGLTAPSGFTTPTPTVPGGPTEPPPTVTTVTTADGTVTTETIPGTATVPEREEIEAEKKEAVADAVFDEKKRAQKRAADAASAARRNAATRAARAAVLSAGLQVSSVNVGAGARSVSVTVASSGVCEIGKTRAGRIASAISRALGGAGATVNVAGSGLAIVQHISARCGKSSKPRSRFVYQLSSGSLGAGPITTRAFRIRSSSWTIRFTNRGSSFKVSLVRGRRVEQPALISIRGAATGVKTVTKKGTFKLRVQGPGSWKIVVREAPR